MKGHEMGELLLRKFERYYVEALNAVLASSPSREDDHDVDRWRGHVEAYRTVCTTVRSEAGLPPGEYMTAEWRKANGVYQADYLAQIHGGAS